MISGCRKTIKRISHNSQTCKRHADQKGKEGGWTGGEWAGKWKRKGKVKGKESSQNPTDAPLFLT